MNRTPVMETVESLRPPIQRQATSRHGRSWRLAFAKEHLAELRRVPDTPTEPSIPQLGPRKACMSLPIRVPSQKVVKWRRGVRRLGGRRKSEKAEVEKRSYLA